MLLPLLQLRINKDNDVNILNQQDGEAARNPAQFGTDDFCETQRAPERQVSLRLAVEGLGDCSEGQRPCQDISTHYVNAR